MPKDELRNNKPRSRRHRIQDDPLTGIPSCKTLIEYLPHKIFLKDIHSVFIACNENMAMGLHIEAADICGKTDYDFFPRELADKYRADDKTTLETGKPREFEENYFNDGQIYYTQCIKIPLKNDEGRITGILGIYQDITQHKLLEKELRENRLNLEQTVRERTEELHRRYKQLQKESTERKNLEDLFSAIFTNSPIGMYLVQAGKFILCSPEFSRNVGYTREDLIGMQSLNIVMPEDRAAVREKAIAMLKGENNTPYEFRGITKNGKTLWAMESVVSVIYRGERSVLGNFMDITQRKELEQKYELLATHDALTGLPTRLLLTDRLDHALKQAQRRNSRLALMMIDLDHFKNINDSLGHDAGDKLLKVVGTGISTVIRQSDTIARLGGDEFVVLLSEIDNTEQCADIASRIFDHFREPVYIGGQRIDVSLSIGISTFPESGADGDTLLKTADKAMYLVKESGRNHYHIFNR